LFEVNFVVLFVCFENLSDTPEFAFIVVFSWVETQRRKSGVREQYNGKLWWFSQKFGTIFDQISRVSWI